MTLVNPPPSPLPPTPPAAPAHDPDVVVGWVVELRARVSDCVEVASRLTQRSAEDRFSFGQEVKVTEEIEHLLQRSTTNGCCIQRSPQGQLNTIAFNVNFRRSRIFAVST